MPRAAQRKRPPLSVEALWSMQRVGSPTLSPDGAWACAPVTSFDMEKNEGSTSLWLFASTVRGRGAKGKRLTEGDKDSAPAWSPDGRYVAFTAKRKDDAEPQVYLIAPDGGEARRLTKLATGASAIKWFADSRRIAFVSWVWPELRGDAAQKKRTDARKADPVKALVTERAEYRYWDHWLADGREPHLFVVDVASGACRDVLAGTGLRLRPWEPAVAEYDVAPDGSDASPGTADRPLATLSKARETIRTMKQQGSLPAGGVADSYATPMISPWSTNPQTTLDAVSGEPKDYVLRAAFVDAFQGQVVARFALDYLHAQRAAVLFDVTSEYNRGIAEFFKQTYEAAGGTVVAYETYTTGETDFSAHLSRIKEAAPDLIFLPNYYTDVPLQVRQAHQLGLQVPCMGSDTWGTPELLTLCGQDCEGYYFSTHYSADAANPITTRFVEAYQAAYGQIPDDVAALTYDSFGLLFQALQAAGRADPQKVNDALHQISRYEGVTGSMLFQQGSGDPIKSAVILQIQAGRFAWFANINP